MFGEGRKFWHKIIIKFSANSREANGGSSCGEGPAEGLVQPVQKKWKRTEVTQNPHKDTDTKGLVCVCVCVCL